MTGTPKLPIRALVTVLLLPLAATVFVACGESPTPVDDPPDVALTVYEHLGPDGKSASFTMSDGSWSGKTYPVRFVRVDAEGGVVLDSLIHGPPTVEDILRPLTADQRAELEEMMGAVAARAQGDQFSLLRENAVKLQEKLAKDREELAQESRRRHP